jgi:glucose dehydrogenase
MVQDSNELLKTIKNSIWADKIEIINKDWKWIWRRIIVIVLVIILIIITIINRTIPDYNPYLFMVITIILSISLFIFGFFINPKLKEIEEKERESKAELKRDKTIKK